MGQYLASAIPNCRATFLPKAGHLLIFDHWPEILSALLEEDRPAPPSKNHA
jgi:pimeloyl-ACP methyl ester carboxylesterase